MRRNANVFAMNEIFTYVPSMFAAGDNGTPGVQEKPASVLDASAHPGAALPDHSVACFGALTW